MNLVRKTRSFCNECYREIPAHIVISKAEVGMVKVCREHGEMFSTVERDPVFYQHITSLNAPCIYGGFFIDVTRRCNLRCKYCFYHLETKDPKNEYALGKIIDECEANAGLAPFIFTGGEPTLRDDLPDLIAKASVYGGVELVTNGVRLATDDAYFNAVTPLLTNNGVTNINLSIHGEETDQWREVIRKAHLSKLALESTLIVVDSKDSFREAVEIAQSTKHAVMSMRIKVATKLWNEQNPENRIFISDMLGWLDEMGGYEIVYQRHNKVRFLNVVHRSCFLMLVAWPDVTNVDLVDIECPPYYRARNGEVRNLVTSCLINEGMDRGCLKGSPWLKP